MAQEAIQTIGNIAVRLPPQANMCIDQLLALLVLEIDHITSKIMVTMTSEDYPIILFPLKIIFTHLLFRYLA